MRADDGLLFSNISATTAAFPLQGGKYGIDCSATFGGGSVQLQKRSADGSTYINAISAFSANALVTADLPQGTYKFAITTATAVYIQIARIPGE